ncbi:RNA pseudouridylate synthase domain-containing protein 1-like [Anneissia japonica]|uniref:RNA pseudouridylate synthase domain-containing protein 1-like n=1 Tax=Anneissia japonica TaxID=1529436 RepID=UPI0014259C4D|nr:RNA pseudouridylate synthase domain-containing protein 1-like [Anneissia japonica]
MIQQTLRAFHLLRLRFWRKLLGMHQSATIDDLEILYKSENFIVISKHYDVKISSNDDSDEVTASKQLAKRFPHLVDTQIEHNFRFVHRLDYSTSGAIAIALNRQAAADAMSKFSKHLVLKEYLALVRGHVKDNHMIITTAICPESKDGCMHMMKIADEEDETRQGIKVKSAKTELSVLQHGYYDGDPATKIRLIPFTGRRHQLRVHCDSIGHTIVGDYTYSNRRDVKPYRMMLHSQKLMLPTDLEKISVDAFDPFVTEIDEKWKPF